MQRLLTVYHDEIPQFLSDISGLSEMRRLRNVGMNCGCEYTGFPRFADLKPYSRFDHSLGTALIIWHFTRSREQAVAGLFHDIATPVFAHVVDFMSGDHVRQESTEEGTEVLLASSEEVLYALQQYGLTLRQVSNYHDYPIADNALPALSADRLEYTFGNLLNYGFASLNDIRAFYEDLVVGNNEAGQEELMFQTPEIAVAFTKAAMRNSHVYVADEDRFAMQALAELLRSALARGVLEEQDLWTTEPEVIEKLCLDPLCALGWRCFRGYSRIIKSNAPSGSENWFQVDAKRRWIDPLVRDKGRVSAWNEEVRKEITELQTLDFAVWLSAE